MNISENVDKDKEGALDDTAREKIQKNLFAILTTTEKRDERQRDFKDFIEDREIQEEDYPIIAELYTYPNDQFIERFHNSINFKKERFDKELKDLIKRHIDDLKLKRFFELFLQFLEKYDWITTNHLNSIMEEKKEWKMGIEESDKNNIKNLPTQDGSLFNTLTEGEEKLIEIQRQDIPQDAINRFERCSARLIQPSEYIPGNFEKYGKIQHNSPSEYTTYFALQEKTTNGHTEKDIYLFEINKEGIKIGHGEIRLGIVYLERMKDFFKDKPFLGYTHTETNYRQQGYGKKRLETMNIISKSIWGIKLHSGTLLAPYAKKTRERLVEEGLAKKYMEGRSERYCFIK